MIKSTRGAFALLLMLLPAQALAHVTIEQREGTIGGSLKVTFRVPHGCSTSATLKVRVRIPDGVVAVKPMPKAGWQLETTKVKYEKTYKVFHGSVSEGVREVSWSGRLPDDNYDEFVVQVFLTDDLVADRMLYFPVVQECENGVHRWIEIPAEGKSAADLPEPAPGVKLLPPRQR